MGAAEAVVPVIAAEPELLRFVVVGSVDDGKSTLIGRLLYEANGLYDDHISQVRRATRQVGEEIDFSLFTDGLRAEREQGITIDVAYRSFATARRRFIVADTPGHVQYTRNMATGASTAEAAVILIDARLRVLPQSRRHAYLASLLGIRHLVVAINKMDLVDFDQATFESIRAEFQPFVEQLGFETVRYFPISARAGDNVVEASARTPWYSGGSLLEFLHAIPVGEARASAPLRFPVQLVLRPDLRYRGFAGQLASGSVTVGDEIVILPSGRRTKVAAIDTFDGPIREAFAPMSVTLRLADEVDVSRGDLIAHPARPPRPVHQLEATVVWMNERPLERGRGYLVKHTTRTVPAVLEQLHSKLDLETLRPVAAETLGLNDVGTLTLRCLRPLCVDAYTEVRGTGAFIIIDALTNDTVAAGMISGGAQQSGGTRVTPELRRLRVGHPGAVVLLSSSPEEAFALEAELFADGLLATVVEDNVEAAIACAKGGLICLLVSAHAPQLLAEAGVRLIEGGDAAAIRRALTQV